MKVKFQKNGPNLGQKPCQKPPDLPVAVMSHCSLLLWHACPANRHDQGGSSAGAAAWRREAWAHIWAQATRSQMFAGGKSPPRSAAPLIPKKIEEIFQSKAATVENGCGELLPDRVFPCTAQGKACQGHETNSGQRLRPLPLRPCAPRVRAGPRRRRALSL